MPIGFFPGHIGDPSPRYPGMRITTVFIVLCLARIAAADPFVGTWKLRPHSDQRIATETIAIDTTATGYKWSYDITARNGNHLQVALLVDTRTKTLTVLTSKGRQIDVGTYKVTG